MSELLVTEAEKAAMDSTLISGQTMTSYLGEKAGINLVVDGRKAESERTALRGRGGKRKPMRVDVSAKVYDKLKTAAMTMNADTIMRIMLRLNQAGEDQAPITIEPGDRIRSNVPKLVKGGNYMEITDAKPNTDVKVTLRKDSDDAIIETKNVAIDSNGNGSTTMNIPDGTSEIKAKLQVEQELVAAIANDGFAIVHKDDQVLSIV